MPETRVSNRLVAPGARISLGCLIAIAWLITCDAGTASAAAGSVIYTYDALGRVTTASYDTGVIVIYTYDANGNRTQRAVNTGTTTLIWSPSTSPNCPPSTNCWGNAVW